MKIMNICGIYLSSLGWPFHSLRMFPRWRDFFPLYCWGKNHFFSFHMWKNWGGKYFWLDEITRLRHWLRNNIFVCLFVSKIKIGFKFLRFTYLNDSVVLKQLFNVLQFKSVLEFKMILICWWFLFSFPQNKQKELDFGFYSRN